MQSEEIIYVREIWCMTTENKIYEVAGHLQRELKGLLKQTSNKVEMTSLIQCNYGNNKKN